MSLLNNKEILTELLALRLQLQFALEHTFTGVPQFYLIAKRMLEEDEYYEPTIDNVRSAGNPFLNYMREHGVSEPRDPPAPHKPYQPADIITPDYEQQVVNEERADQGDDTEEMIKLAFRNEFGLHAVTALNNGAGPAVGLYETFKANWYYQQSKLGG